MSSRPGGARPPNKMADARADEEDEDEDEDDDDHDGAAAISADDDDEDDDDDDDEDDSEKDETKEDRDAAVCVGVGGSTESSAGTLGAGWSSTRGVIDDTLDVANVWDRDDGAAVVVDGSGTSSMFNRSAI
jgi:hypothetical protein